MRKDVLVLVFLFFGSAVPSWAQKFGYVDTEFIFSKMPEYQKALTEIDRFADKWSRDIQDKYAEVEKLQKAYQAEEVLLTEDMKRDRQRIINEKEREAREYNNKVFGYEGLLYQKKKELIKAPMELVNKAIEKVAVQKKLNFMFDKASDFVMLYTDPRHDYTDYVMEELGLDTDTKANRTTASAGTGTTAGNPVVAPGEQPNAAAPQEDPEGRGRNRSGAGPPANSASKTTAKPK